MSARLVAIALLAATAASGCRALGVSQPRPELVPPVATLPVAQMVEDHNRNAAQVRSLEAEPSVSIRSGRMGGGTASGRMALVRPRDFRLSLDSMRGRVADIGSNNDEFWVWSSRSEDKEYYVGHYDANGETSSELVLKPEWIIEAMGLRVIPDSEARAITVERGDSASTLKLVHHRYGPNGEPLVKKTVVDRQTGQVVQHQFFGPDGASLLAKATPSEYHRFPVGGAETSGGVVLPTRLRLDAMPNRDTFSMDLTLGTLSAVKINQFAESRRAALFQVPEDFEKQGYARVDLDEQLRSVRGGPNQVRETMPAPPAGAGRVRLEAPVSVGADDQARRASDPAPLAADLPPSAGSIDAVVGARLPRPPGVSEPSPIGESAQLEHPGGRLR
jgi:hypothetical protein